MKGKPVVDTATFSSSVDKAKMGVVGGRIVTDLNSQISYDLEEESNAKKMIRCLVLSTTPKTEYDEIESTISTFIEKAEN